VDGIFFVQGQRRIVWQQFPAVVLIQQPALIEPPGSALIPAPAFSY
jgi:hypothetical protein